MKFFKVVPIDWLVVSVALASVVRAKPEGSMLDVWLIVASVAIGFGAVVITILEINKRIN